MKREKLVWDRYNKPATRADIYGHVGPGWEGILSTLLDELVALGWGGVILSVKEKFGGLRFYAKNTSEVMCAAIRAAEQLSFKTCEQCGEPGSLHKGQYGWLKTLCLACQKKREARYEQ